MKAAAVFYEQVSYILAKLSDAEETRLDSDSLLCGSLERVLPQCLSNEYPEWRGESLDGVFDAVGIRVNQETLTILGIAILMSDQRVTPFYCEIRSKSQSMELEIKLGQRGEGRLGISGPKLRTKKYDLIRLNLSKHSVDWVFSTSCQFSI